MDFGANRDRVLPDFAEAYIDIVGVHQKWKYWDLIIDPFAIDNNFFERLPTVEKLAFGQTEGTRSNFLNFTVDRQLFSKILVIGHIPIGKANNMAKKYFNHAAMFAEMIAVVVPQSFRHVETQNSLNLQFRLIFDVDVPDRAFKYAKEVIYCFQIWQRTDDIRSIQRLYVEHNDFTIVKSQDEADFAIRRNGPTCGKIIVKEDFSKYHTYGWFWVKAYIDVNTLIERLSKLDYSVCHKSIKYYNLNKRTLVRLYSTEYQ